ncbi:putative agamous-like MADS-box protein AGL61 [Iris pallida]|uniref:Agamous-like MADS-box protein AGL61 n=1 Tax=Iris pallida TaxID=29817 RepID=A0AAX6G1H4_IRIPA|nr:putative agamous-like MADS-box protein AGL61 [Iris pallida]
MAGERSGGKPTARPLLTVIFGWPILFKFFHNFSFNFLSNPFVFSFLIITLSLSLSQSHVLFFFFFFFFFFFCRSIDRSSKAADIVSNTMVVGGKGKKKIEITRIVEKPKRRVTFSKRRKGLFKKAAELNVLCGSDTAVISVSKAGTVFAAGRPSLVHGLLLGTGATDGGRGVELDCTRLERMGWDDLVKELAALNKSQLEIELLMANRNAAASVMSQKAHVFVDAAAAATAPPPAFPTPSSSGGIEEDESTGLLPLTSGGCSGGLVGDREDEISDFLEYEELIALPTLSSSGLEDEATGLLPLPIGCSGGVVGNSEDEIFDFLLEDEELIALPTLSELLEDETTCLLSPASGSSGPVGDSGDDEEIFDLLQDEELIALLQSYI